MRLPSESSRMRLLTIGSVGSEAISLDMRIVRPARPGWRIEGETRAPGYYELLVSGPVRRFAWACPMMRSTEGCRLFEDSGEEGTIIDGGPCP